ncbi:MAG: hypothetical protein HQL24_07175 [Candidatus Omnitrophica bacterium]|nr:hypothetical protein [Candidatus Omnitrophota bacterium]
MLWQGTIRKSRAAKAIHVVLIISFALNFIFPPQFASAQPMAVVTASPVGLTPAFNPVVIRGIKIFPDNPLKFDFIVDTAQSNLKDEAFKQESTKLIKYFLASLTTPEDDMWVNLNPKEPDRIVPEKFGVTEMGRDLLAQDYLLKQITSSLMNPEKEIGKAFWDKIYKKSYELYGTTEVPVDTLNKVWIIPAKAVVYEQGDKAFVIEAKLKVMLEDEYGAINQSSLRHSTPTPLSSPQSLGGDPGLHNKATAMDSRLRGNDRKGDGNDISSSIIKEIIIPELEKEVNVGKSFAPLRQIYYSMILATWFKRSLKESILGKVFVDQNKTAGVEIKDKQEKLKIYDQYLETLKKGAYNYIKEEYDSATRSIVPKKYFSGGVRLKLFGNGIDDAILVTKDKAMLSKKLLGAAVVALGVVLSSVPEAHGQFISPVHKTQVIDSVDQRILNTAQIIVKLKKHPDSAAKYVRDFDILLQSYPNDFSSKTFWYLNDKLVPTLVKFVKNHNEALASGRVLMSLGNPPNPKERMALFSVQGYLSDVVPVLDSIMIQAKKNEEFRPNDTIVKALAKRISLGDTTAVDSLLIIVTGKDLLTTVGNDVYNNVLGGVDLAKALRAIYDKIGYQNSYNLLNRLPHISGAVAEVSRNMFPPQDWKMGKLVEKFVLLDNSTIDILADTLAQNGRAIIDYPIFNALSDAVKQLKEKVKDNDSQVMLLLPRLLRELGKIGVPGVEALARNISEKPFVDEIENGDVFQYQNLKLLFSLQGVNGKDIMSLVDMTAFQQLASEGDVASAEVLFDYQENQYNPAHSGALLEGIDPATFIAQAMDNDEASINILRKLKPYNDSLDKVFNDLIRKFIKEKINPKMLNTLIRDKVLASRTHFLQKEKPAGQQLNDTLEQQSNGGDPSLLYAFYTSSEAYGDVGDSIINILKGHVKDSMSLLSYIQNLDSKKTLYRDFMFQALDRDHFPYLIQDEASMKQVMEFIFKSFSPNEFSAHAGLIARFVRNTLTNPDFRLQSEFQKYFMDLYKSEETPDANKYMIAYLLGLYKNDFKLLDKKEIAAAVAKQKIIYENPRPLDRKKLLTQGSLNMHMVFTDSGAINDGFAATRKFFENKGYTAVDTFPNKVILTRGNVRITLFKSADQSYNIDEGLPQAGIIIFRGLPGVESQVFKTPSSSINTDGKILVFLTSGEPAIRGLLKSTYPGAGIISGVNRGQDDEVDLMISGLIESIMDVNVKNMLDIETFIRKMYLEKQGMKEMLDNTIFPGTPVDMFNNALYKKFIQGLLDNETGFRSLPKTIPPHSYLLVRPPSLLDIVGQSRMEEVLDVALLETDNAIEKNFEKADLGLVPQKEMDALHQQKLVILGALEAIAKNREGYFNRIARDIMSNPSANLIFTKETGDAAMMSNSVAAIPSVVEELEQSWTTTPVISPFQESSDLNNAVYIDIGLDQADLTSYLKTFRDVPLNRNILNNGIGQEAMGLVYFDSPGTADPALVLASRTRSDGAVNSHQAFANLLGQDEKAGVKFILPFTEDGQPKELFIAGSREDEVNAQEERQRIIFSANLLLKMIQGLYAQPQDHLWTLLFVKENILTLEDLARLKKQGGHSGVYDLRSIASLPVDHAQVSDSAMTSTKGGIDLNPKNISIEGKGEKIQFNSNINLEELKNAAGFIPVIIHVSPITNAYQFLEIK